MSFLRSFLQSVVQDLRFGFRSFRDTPLFAVAALMTLTLGIAANTAIFSVMNSVLLNSLPFQFMRDPSRVVMVWQRAPLMSKVFADSTPVRLKDFREWKKANRSFTDMAIWRNFDANLTDAEVRRHRPERVEAGMSSPNLLPMLGIKLERGRYFRADEGSAGNNRVAIISDALYRSRFGGDKNILGRKLRVDGADFEIAGVLPKDFELPAMMGGFDRKKVAFWIPMNMTEKAGAADRMNCFVYARLKKNATVESAQSDMQVVQRNLVKTEPELQFFSGTKVASVFDEDAGADMRRSLWVLQIAVGLVLLIACANVANLMLTRAVGREKEMAVRTALGASHWRLLRQMLTESLLLSAIAGAAGTFLAYGALRLVSYLAPPDTHGLHELRLDSSVLLFTTGLSVAAGILFGFAAYWQVRKQNINEALNRASRSVSGSSSSTRNLLTIVELALSMILLIGAGLMIRTLANLMSTDLGFQRDHLLSMQISLPESRYSNAQQAKAFDSQLMSAVRQMPGVRSALMTTAIPMQSFQESSYRLKGRVYKQNEMPVSAWARVSDNYFETLGTRLISGRTLRPDDASSGKSAVAVVNQAFARKNGGENGILGKVIEFDGENGKPGDHRIVGVVANEHQMGPESSSEAQFFVPGHALRSFYLLVRTAGDPLSSSHAVQSQVWQIDSQLPVGNVRSMEGVLHEWTAPKRFLMSILFAFAALALILAAIGLYSVLAYSVTLRTREIGIRVALGAEPNRVARAIVFDGFKLAVGGIVLGLIGAALLAQFMQSLIFGVDAIDPLTFVLVPCLLGAVALAASYLPARRAARVDPTVALRAE